MRGINIHVKSQEATLADFYKILLLFSDNFELNEIITKKWCARIYVFEVYLIQNSGMVKLSTGVI